MEMDLEYYKTEDAFDYLLDRIFVCGFLQHSKPPTAIRIVNWLRSMAGLQMTQEKVGSLITDEKTRESAKKMIIRVYAPVYGWRPVNSM